MFKRSLPFLACLVFILVNAAPDGGYPLGKKEYYIDMPIDHFTNGGRSLGLFSAEVWTEKSGHFAFEIDEIGPQHPRSRRKYVACDADVVDADAFDRNSGS
jgi:hypothetical protein